MPGVAPQLAARIYEAWEKGDHRTGFAAQHSANTFSALLRGLHAFAPAAAKAVLSRLGIMEKWVAPPKTPLSDGESERAFVVVKAFLPEFESD